MSIAIVISLSIVQFNLLAQHTEERQKDSLKDAAKDLERWQDCDEVFRPSLERAIKHYNKISDGLLFISMMRTFLTYAGWLSLFFIELN